MGGSHEDVVVDEAIIQLEQFLIGGYSGYGAPLKHVAVIVLDAGKQFISWLAQTQGYQSHYFLTSHKPL